MSPFYALRGVCRWRVIIRVGIGVTLIVYF